MKLEVSMLLHRIAFNFAFELHCRSRNVVNVHLLWNKENVLRSRVFKLKKGEKEVVMNKE